MHGDEIIAAEDAAQGYAYPKSWSKTPLTGRVLQRNPGDAILSVMTNNYIEALQDELQAAQTAMRKTRLKEFPMERPYVPLSTPSLYAWRKPGTRKLSSKHKRYPVWSLT